MAVALKTNQRARSQHVKKINLVPKIVDHLLPIKKDLEKFASKELLPEPLGPIMRVFSQHVPEMIQ